MILKKLLPILIATLTFSNYAFAADDDNEPKVDWKSSIALGSTYKRSTVSKMNGTLNLKTARYAKKSDWISSLYGSYGETEGLQTDGQLRAKSDFRYKLLGKNTFYGGLYTETYHNSVKDVSLRLRASPSLGYYFIYRDALKLDASAGSTFTYERPSGETKNFGSIRIAGSYDHKITDTTTYYLSAEYNMSMEDSADNDGSLVTGIKAKITKNLSLNLEFRDQYENISGRSNTRRNDITVTTGISYDFG
ncbi:MAG: DUF481 domain-containing protein [Pontiellaceae bacterium]|nr:DUF481 domain-containing protein [Pontiellaceae bacterium]